MALWRYNINSFYSRYFKKRAADKFLRRPPGGSDTESLEDVEDDEFERILGTMDQEEKSITSYLLTTY